MKNKKPTPLRQLIKRLSKIIRQRTEQNLRLQTAVRDTERDSQKQVANLKAEASWREDEIRKMTDDLSYYRASHDLANACAREWCDILKVSRQSWNTWAEFTVLFREFASKRKKK